MSTRIAGGRSWSRALAVAFVLLGAVTVVSCSGDSSDSGDSASSATPTAPDTASFTGTGPSSVASAASSVIDSARASASAAASSASAAASSFEASVSADTARAAEAARTELKKVQGSGNATSQVAMTGLPRARTGGLLAVLVTITNKTDRKASYAVQIDFEDADGKVVETRYVGAQDLGPGKKAQPVAISEEPTESKLTPRLAKAQRY